MYIPDKYRDRYDNLARSHPWMREMRDEQAPEGDVAAILRKAATCTSANTSVGDVLRYNVPGNEPSAWQTAEDACMVLADMVERDYVSRQDFAAQHRMLCAVREQRDHESEANRSYARVIAKLEAERDELKAFSGRLETAAHDKLGVTLFGVDYVTEDFMLHVRDTLTAERDGLKAMNDRLQVALDAVEGCDERCKKLEAERDELKERTEHYSGHVDRLMEAICGLARKQPRTFDPQAPYENAELVGKYIDELEAERDEWRVKAEQCNPCGWWNSHMQYCERTDNDAHAKAEGSSNFAKLFDESEWFAAMVRVSVAALMQQGEIDLDGKTIDEWLMSPHGTDGELDGNGTCPDSNGTASNRNPFYAVADALGVNCADRADERIAERMLEVLMDDWMELPRDKYDEVIHLEDVMTAPGEDCWTVLAVNEGGFLTFHEDGSYHMRSCRDWQHTLGPVDAHSKAHSTTEPKLSEQSESLSDDCVRNDGETPENGVSADDVDSNDANADSREKLEADVRWQMGHFFAWDETREEFVGYVLEWLDRQAAITHSIDAWNIKRLENRLKVAQDVNERQDLEYVSQCERIAELQKQVDELTVRAVAAETEADELKAIVDRLKAENAELRGECADCAVKRANRVLSQSVDRLTRERDALAVDLADAMDEGL